MADQEGRGVLAGLGQCVYDPAGNRHFPQREPGFFQLTSQFKDRPTAGEELPVRAGGTQRRGQLGSGERLGDG